MQDTDWQAQRFEHHRTRLTAVARRILGSPSEAEDAVQEAWLRFSRSDAAAIDDLGAWLTTVVSRVCLTALQTRRTHPEVPYEPELSEPSAESGPEDEALLADSIGLALLVVLDPEIVVTGDATVVALGAPPEMRGKDVVAPFLRRARGATPALLDGLPAAVWVPDGVLRVAFAFTAGEDTITRIELIADPERLRELDLVIQAG